MQQKQWVWKVRLCCNQEVTWEWALQAQRRSGLAAVLRVLQYLGKNACQPPFTCCLHTRPSRCKWQRLCLDTWCALTVGLACRVLSHHVSQWSWKDVLWHYTLNLVSTSTRSTPCMHVTYEILFLSHLLKLWLPVRAHSAQPPVEWNYTGNAKKQIQALNNTVAFAMWGTSVHAYE